MITADPMAIFPACPTFGFTSEPMYRVVVVRRDSGFESRDRKWSRPLHRYTGVPMGDKAQEDIQALLYFWHAMGGMTTAFRFKDWADYKSCMVHETPSVSNWSPIFNAEGSSPSSPPDLWQLFKRYSYGSIDQDREIRHPIGSSIVIANDSGDVQSPVDWSLDEGTGLLSIGDNFVGTPSFWFGEFDVPVRFDSEFPVELTNHQIERVTVSLCEVRE